MYPDKVLGSRVIIQGGNEVQQTLIQWKNKALEDVTWEHNEVLCCQFPEFCLEDKALSKDLVEEEELKIFNKRIVKRRRKGDGYKSCIDLHFFLCVCVWIDEIDFLCVTPFK